MAIWNGSYGVSHGASAATSTIKPASAAPRTRARLLRARASTTGIPDYPYRMRGSSHA